eukprot:2503535-Prymnesium_polylepis.1
MRRGVERSLSMDVEGNRQLSRNSQYCSIVAGCRTTHIVARSATDFVGRIGVRGGTVVEFVQPNRVRLREARIVARVTRPPSPVGPARAAVTGVSRTA